MGILVFGRSISRAAGRTMRSAIVTSPNADPENLLPTEVAPKVVSPSQVGPPRAWILLADWGNTLAGLVLIAAFLEGALINSVKMEALLDHGVPTDKALAWLQFLFSAEGLLYAVAEFFMIGIMALTPEEVGGGPRGCLQFAILMAGGIFFGLSGLVYPGCITNMTYVFRNEDCPLPGHGPYVWNAMAHFGITCFMCGTTIGFLGVRNAPKNKLVSPFWGVTMFFLGAWTIGIFKFWGPVWAGGFETNMNAGDGMFNAPTNTWTWNWWLGVLGASFLTLGAMIFGLMNGSFGFRCGQ